MRFLLSALLVILPSLCALADGVEIRQRYKNGFRYKQVVTILQESSVSTGLSNSTTKTNTALDIESTATALDKGAGTSIAVRYTKIAMSLDRDGKKFSFDSGGVGDAATTGPLQSLSGAIGRGYNVVLDESGNVGSVQEAQSALAALSGPSPTTAALYRDLFGAESIKRLFEQSMLRTPKGAAPKAGDSWPLSQEIKLPGLGKLIFTGSYSLVGMSDFDGRPCAQIAVSATISQEPPERVIQDLQDDDRFDTLSRQMKLKLPDSTVKGTIYFDPAISFPRGISLTQVLNIEAKIPDGTANVIKMPIKQSISIRLAEMTDVHPQ